MDRRNFIKISGILLILSGLVNQVTGKETLSKNNNFHKLNKGVTMKHKCKITVLKRECYTDLQEQYLANPKAGKCEFFEDGQEFIVDNDEFFRMMHGKFCSEAWDCISRYVYAALQGGSIMNGWSKDEKVMITCCNDGTRPVIFKLERIDEVV